MNRCRNTIYILISIIMFFFAVNNVRASGVYNNTNIPLPNASYDQYGQQIGQYNMYTTTNIGTSNTSTYSNNDNTIIITPYIIGGGYLSFASGAKNALFNYNQYLKDLQYGWMLGGGIFINNNWGVGLSLNGLYGNDKLSKDNKNFNSLNLKSYILNIDATFIIPFTFYDRLHFYVIGGFNIIFNSIDADYKVKEIDANIANSMNKNSLGLSIGAGLEFQVTQKVFARAEVKREFVLTSGILGDFWITGISLVYKI